MEMSDFYSHKYLHNGSIDPLANIFRQLRDLGSMEGDYIRIIEKQAFFQPIYKISYLQQPKIKRDNSLRKSFFRDSSNQQNAVEQKLTYESQEKFRLSFGSQIYLKYNNLQTAKIALLKPHFPNLFVQLRNRKGLIHCQDGKIMLNPFQKTQSIWMCISTGERQGEDPSRQEVYFCNFVENEYLYMDNNGVMTVCGEEKATRFILNQMGNSNDFILQGRNILSQLVRNKSKEEIKKIIDRSIERQEGSKKTIEVELEIIPVEDTMITIHLELNYSKRALESQPSLKLIQLVLNELIYYDILDFLRDGSILSQHIQELLLQYEILKLVAEHVSKYFEVRNLEDHEPILVLPRRSSQVPQSKFSKKSAKNQYDEQAIEQVLKVIGLLCRQNIEISKIFLDLLNQMIENEQYPFAAILLQKNQYFLSQFHKNKWYERLYRIIGRSGKTDICKIVNFLSVFCEGQKELSLVDSSIEYRHKPSTNNQYLLHHSVKSGDFFAKIFQYELYIQGNYVFAHDTKVGKDVEFHTFVEGEAKSRPPSIIVQNMIKIENQDSDQHQVDIELVLAQLKLVKSLFYNYNPNIILSNWTIAYGLAPYCYKDNFPQLTHQQIKRVIFRMLIELEPYYKEAKLLSTFLVSCSLVQTDNNGRNSMREESPKMGVSTFVKNNKKRVQTSRKILKEMGNYFLKKTKEWSQSIKKKQLHITQLCNNYDENFLPEWLELMIQVLSMRLFKVKEKKEGQLLGYIKKLFESIEEKKGVVENQGNLMNQFIEILLDIIKTESKYDKYLQQFKAKRVYDGKPNQINKVISNFQGKKSVNFSRSQKGLTKIQLIDLVYKGLSQQQQNLRESSRREQEIFNQESFKEMKLVSLRLVQLMILNVNEEMVDEAVDTLTYLMKNPGTISNLSSFSLLDMIPKYPSENLIKRIMLQQWYLSSNCHLLNEFTEILRLIYTKKLLFRRNINNVLLIDSQPAFKTYHHIVYPVKFLKKVLSHCQTWLRPSLLDKYPDIYAGVDKNMMVIIDCLEKLSDYGEHLQISKIIENVDLIAILSLLVEYMSSYYLQRPAIQLEKSKIFSQKHETLFLETKLNPLAQKICKILTLYVQDKKENDLFRTKMIIHTFGELFSSIPEFTPTLMHIFKKSIDSNESHLLRLLSSFSPVAIFNLAKNFNMNWHFFEIYLSLQGEQLLKKVQTLFQAGFNKLSEAEEEIFLANFLQCSGKYNESNSESKYEYWHQIILMRLLLKLIYNNYFVDVVFWFRDKVFWQLLQTLSRSNAQNYYMLELSSQEIKRRQLITQLAFYYRESASSPQSLSVISDKEENAEQEHLVIDFILEEHQLSKLYVEIGPFNNNNQIRKIPDNAFIEYLQYLVCDLTILAYFVEFLVVGELYDDMQRYCEKLKEIYKSRMMYKSNEDTYATFSNVEKIFSKEVNIKFQCKMRQVKLQTLHFSASVEAKEVKQPSKPIRKWMKAVAQLNKQKFLSKNSELIEDILTFEDIYELKNESEQINLVINHNDILLKLFQVSLNLQRLKINPQNQIFILENILLVSKAKSKNRKEMDQGLMQYGVRLLELLLQEEVGMEAINKQQSFEFVERWKQNTYTLALVLKIVEHSRCLEFYQTWNAYIDQLVYMFGLSFGNYRSDHNFLQLYFSTLHSDEEKEIFQVTIPFQILLSIFVKQIETINMSNTHCKYLSQIVLKAYLSLDLNEECTFRSFNGPELFKVIESIDKDIAQEVFQDINKYPFYKSILTLRK